MAITGYRQKGKQAAWLKKEKIDFRLNAFGKPVVSRSYWDRTNSGQPKRRNTNTTPNWAEQRATT